jgi:hypothetical protein
MDREYALPTSPVIGAKGLGVPGLFNRKVGDQCRLIGGDVVIYALMVSEPPALQDGNGPGKNGTYPRTILGDKTAKVLRNRFTTFPRGHIPNQKPNCKCGPYH